MEYMTNTNIPDGAYGGRRTNAGAPSNGTSEIQLLTIGGTPTAGSMKFQTDAGVLSIAATWSATNATLLANLQAALDALLGTNECVAAALSLTAGIGTINLTFGGNSAAKNVPALTAVSSLTGSSPTAVITTATAGVTATHRGSPPGTVCQDTTNGDEYVNQGTAVAPEWNKVTTS